MSVFSIGRCNFLEAPQSWDDDGVSVSCSGKAFASSPELAAFWEHQLRGLAASDEDAVPVIWPGSPDLSGWYRVRSMSVPRERGVSAPAEKSLRWSGRLERCRTFRSPLHEITVHGAKLDNDHGYVKATTFPGVGIGAGDNLRGVDTTSAGKFVTRTADSGAGIYLYSDVGTSSPYYDGIIGGTALIESHYVGTSIIECDVTGSGGFETVVGREFPDVSNDWRIGNGLVRYSPNGSLGQIACEVYDSGTWQTFATIEVLGSAASGDAPAILHNAPNMATLRLARGAGFLDITVRRGELGARCVLKDESAGAWVIDVLTSGAGTTGTGFTRATSNDANGNRWLLCIPAAFTRSTVGGLANTGHVIDVAALSMRFGIYCNLDGSGAAAGDTVADLVAQYYAGVTDRVTVEGR